MPQEKPKPIAPRILEVLEKLDSKMEIFEKIALARENVEKRILNGSGKLEYEKLGEEDYIGFNITLGQDEPIVVLRTSSNLPEGVAAAYAECEKVTREGLPFLDDLLDQLYMELQYLVAENRRGVSDMNATISRKYEKRYVGAAPPEYYTYEEEEETKKGGIF